MGTRKLKISREESDVLFPKALISLIDRFDLWNKNKQSLAKRGLFYNQIQYVAMQSICKLECTLNRGFQADLLSVCTDIKSRININRLNSCVCLWRWLHSTFWGLIAATGGDPGGVCVTMSELKVRLAICMHSSSVFRKVVHVDFTMFPASSPA